MEKTKRKLISGVIMAGCALFGIGAAAHLNSRINEKTMPVSLGVYSEEPPVIVLDAGHGESA